MSHKVLVVDDTSINRELIFNILKVSDNEYDVLEASNGKEGYESAVSNLPDVILMDLRIPKMDGIQATKIIKEKSLSEAPIIGMTASVMNDERESYIAAGMDVLVEKPVNFDNLVSMIKTKLN